MKKSVVIFVLVLSMIMSLQVSAHNFFDDKPLYDENGRVMHMDIMENQKVASGEYVFTGDFDISTADKCKLFIWEDFRTFKPLDTAKVFNMNMYSLTAEMQ